MKYIYLLSMDVLVKNWILIIQKFQLWLTKQALVKIDLHYRLENAFSADDFFFNFPSFLSCLYLPSCISCFVMENKLIGLKYYSSSFFILKSKAPLMHLFHNGFIHFCFTVCFMICLNNNFYYMYIFLFRSYIHSKTREIPKNISKLHNIIFEYFYLIFIL